VLKSGGTGRRRIPALAGGDDPPVSPHETGLSMETRLELGALIGTGTDDIANCIVMDLRFDCPAWQFLGSSNYVVVVH
jgi:hypothetical protein